MREVLSKNKEICKNCNKEYWVITKYSIINEGKHTSIVDCPYCKNTYEITLGKHEDIETQAI